MNAKKKTKTPPCIKVYTTPKLMAAFAAHAEAQGRSLSGHGEFLFKQDLERACERKP